MATRLTYLHPYPAMIADPLAEELSLEFVRPGVSLLDPFCGAGRILLAGARNGANCVGVDVNPLASLLVQAKSANYSVLELEEFLCEIERSALPRASRGKNMDLGTERKVAWFSEDAIDEMEGILTIINSKARSKAITLLAGAVLSATAREVSYCRNDRWKLHRIPANRRVQHKPSAKAVFCRRFKVAISEIKYEPFVMGNCKAVVGDCKNLKASLEAANESGQFDVVFTSPPYGDSKTTVQYGGMSSICLSVISNINGLEHLRMSGKEIDTRCLGGRVSVAQESAPFMHDRFSVYWRGATSNSASLRVYQYLSDLEKACLEIAGQVRRHGQVIFVVARRRVGGWRLHLDCFVEDVLSKLKFELRLKYDRKIKRKLLPCKVQRFARLKSLRKHKGNTVPTMSREFILIFEKTN